MTFNNIVFLRCLVVAVTALGGFNAVAVQAPNPRGSTVPLSNNRSSDSDNVSRAATSRTGVRSPARGAVVSNAARGGASVARSATPIATIRGSNARTATNGSTARTATAPNTSRAGVARATSVFNDLSKIGTGYSMCRESYATCMDQFCANANDTYRRCYCSSRFMDFRNTENALDQAKTLLMQFEDNNLNAVDKTAAEVTAMYSPTVGEAAIKKDTSAAAKILEEIGDLLSGKKKVSSSTGFTNSLGIMSLDFSDDIDDIWSNGEGSVFYGGVYGQNLAELDGVNLYNAANKQCMNIVSDSCSTRAVADMARSSYSIMITQDCNAYQKSIDKKVESVKQTVRTAEKYLREARLAEYRSHNSADVNECITKVRTALTADTACGANYKRCLDYTGAYISQSTGEPIYSPRLFKLTELINLSGADDTDILAENEQFNKFLESRKIFATAALDTCRSISSLVWNEFKRTALIEIAQAQDEKIEEVKMSCVGTMADCYDTQTSALRDFDTTTAQMTGALSAYAAKQMCMDKVSACAALYSPGEGATECKFDAKSGKLLNETACGLASLLKFVDSVDTVRIAEGCEVALRNYTTELCTPTTGTMEYPWNCRLLNVTDLKKNITNMASTYCSTDVVKYDSSTVTSIIDNIVTDVTMSLSELMLNQCESLGGLWVESSEYVPNYDDLKSYYNTVYNGNKTYVDNSKTWGRCIESNTKVLCESYNLDDGSGVPLTTYNSARDTCSFSTEWYKKKCTEELGGTWEDSVCYIK